MDDQSLQETNHLLVTDNDVNAARNDKTQVETPLFCSYLAPGS